MTLQIALLAMTLAAPRVGADAALRERVMTIVANSGAEVAVAFATLDGRDEMLLDPDKPFHAASTMKVPVMIELFRQAQAGQLSLDDRLPIRNEFHSIVDGSVYQLDVSDDSDSEVYKAIGQTLPLRQLCEAMITVSSNFAANLLIERLGVENIKATVAGSAPTACTCCAASKTTRRSRKDSTTRRRRAGCSSCFRRSRPGRR